MKQSESFSDLRRQMAAKDAHYRAEKLGLGGSGTHEGWIGVEEAWAASNTPISAEARHKMIAVAAYYLAEKRGFAEHGACEDWMKAEAKIDSWLHSRT